MPIVTMLDELGKPAWIALTILGFMIWWPLGLAVMTCLIWSGNMRCCGFGFGDWGVDTGRQAHDGWVEPRPSGNRVFEEYRAETLRRLEEEQREFREFLLRLRMAKDKAEFDQFKGERRGSAQTAPARPQ